MSEATVQLYSSPVPAGRGRVGELVQMKKTGQLFKITKAMKVNYQVMDEDGRLWKIQFSGVTEAPDGVVWCGPAPAKKTWWNFNAGDVVRVKNDSKFPHLYLVVRKTAEDRYKLQRIGGTGSLTAPGNCLIGAYKELENAL